MEELDWNDLEKVEAEIENKNEHIERLKKQISETDLENKAECILKSALEDFLNIHENDLKKLKARRLELVCGIE